MEENLVEIEREIKELRELLVRAERAYYVESKPIMEDIEYDGKFDRLKELEERYPQFYDENSPTVRVGSDIDNTLPEKEHTIPVLSLDKCYSIEDLEEWIEKNEKKFSDQFRITLEPKIDGAGLVLYYKEGRLESALTRGNGFVGNDITENIKTIRTVPLTIDYKGELAVRGEVYIGKADFKAFNDKYADGAYANPRNLASGSMRRQKSSETARYPLNIFLYEGFFKDKTFDNHLDNLIYLKELGFAMNDHLGLFGTGVVPAEELPFTRAVCGGFTEIDGYIREFTRLRPSLEYEIDGLVAKIDNLEVREELGFTKHHPRWAIAYKFEAPMAQTRVTSIVAQVGRGGRVTPVANLEPVLLSGSTIARATLHNQDYIDSLEVNVGDLVAISKRGDVIPAIEEVIEKGEHSSPFKLDEHCPDCGSILINEGAHLFCQNGECPSRVMGRLCHFVGRNQMDIESLGEKTLQFLYEKELVKGIGDIYEIDYFELLKYEGYKEKKITNIMDAVAKSKEKSFPIVLAALGLKDIGGRAAELLAERFKNVDALIEVAKAADVEELSSIDGVGELMAKSIIKSFTDEATLNLIERLKSAGLKFELEVDENAPAESELFLKETKWVVTGSFDNFKPRDRAKDLIKQYGGTILSSVSSKTDYLLSGKDAGSKLAKAEKLGVEVIDEAAFLALLEKNGVAL